MVGIYVCLVGEILFVMNLEREKTVFHYLWTESEFYAHKHRPGIYDKNLCGWLKQGLYISCSTFLW